MTEFLPSPGPSRLLATGRRFRQIVSSLVMLALHSVPASAADPAGRRS